MQPPAAHGPAPARHPAPLLTRLLAAVSVAALTATVAGSLGAWHWLLDLASHFRWYWLLAAALGLACSIRPLRPLPAACCGLAVAVNAWAMAPFWLPATPAGLPRAAAATPHSTAPPLALVTLNVHRLNPDRSAAVAYLRDRAADVVVSIEVDEPWAAALSSLDDLYPHRLVVPRDDNFGLAVLSRWPLEDARAVELGGTPRPNIVTRVRHAAGPFLLVATHPTPPYSAAASLENLAQLMAVADVAAAATLPCIVAGDFNATPWSHAYRTFAARCGLRDTALGRGVQPTWNARLAVPRIPIDHVFASPDVTVLDRRIGPDVGSDHFPVEAVLVLPERR